MKKIATNNVMSALLMMLLPKKLIILNKFPKSSKLSRGTGVNSRKNNLLTISRAKLKSTRMENELWNLGIKYWEFSRKSKSLSFKLLLKR